MENEFENGKINVDNEQCFFNYAEMRGICDSGFDSLHKMNKLLIHPLEGGCAGGMS
jgi:hypothetical protein